MTKITFSELKAILARHAFPVCMALFMVYGMELYNHILMSGSFSFGILLSPFSELIPMSVAVLLVEGLLGGRIVEAILSRFELLQQTRIPHGVVVGAVTCIVMCPLMSMVATLVFKHPTLATIVPLWFFTFIRNLPFALVWALVVARPASSAVVKRLGEAQTSQK